MLKELICRINAYLIDLQLRHRFKIDKYAPKVCMWCGKAIEKTDKYEIWVHSDGKTLYECDKCGKEIRQLKELMLNDFCKKRRYSKKPGIEECINCPQFVECEYRLRIVEDEFRQTKKKTQRTTCYQVTCKNWKDNRCYYPLHGDCEIGNVVGGKESEGEK